MMIQPGQWRKNTAELTRSANAFPSFFCFFFFSSFSSSSPSYKVRRVIQRSEKGGWLYVVYIKELLTDYYNVEIIKPALHLGSYCQGMKSVGLGSILKYDGFSGGRYCVGGWGPPGSHPGRNPKGPRRKEKVPPMQSPSIHQTSLRCCPSLVTC